MQENLSFSDRDEFQRKVIAENIIKLLKPEADISPLVIDGDWGTGKTEFSIKLKNLITAQEPESKVVYIDAFKGDHAESPLLLITSAIASILPEEEQKTFIKKALPAIRFGLKTGLKASAGWVLRQNADNMATELQEAIKKASNAAIDGTIENILEDHMEAEKNINSLKNCIQGLSSQQKTVIIIDELDRCKPSFSTAILETIKHIFDTENVYFILVTNTTQLRASINHIYGYSLDSQKYLDKFIKYTITLPDTFLKNGFDEYKTSVEYWSQLTKENPSLLLIHQAAGDEICKLISDTNLSLRETQTFARNLNIFQKINDNTFTQNTDYLFKLIIIGSVYIHCFGDKLLLKGDLSSDKIDKLADLFKIKKIPYEFLRSNEVSRITILFYGIIKENINVNKKFAPPNEELLEKFDSFYKRLEDDYFYNTTVKEQVIKYLNQMSFIK
ncbi:P-loop NTPase fold protein [Citrobacter sp. Marseille-Q3906]|uniref:KAP family NTPase n=1 Tax=Citrobacter sp. Marseille-Q3906 TaxID=2866574 RepID=UPI001CE45424|nr:P-loop NTPase fold protein [Citrobacter sp. Marseille-Q3906]